MVLPLLKVAGTMFDEGVSHPLAREAHDSGHRPAPGKQTRTERIAPARGAVGGTSSAVGGTSDAVGGTSDAVADTGGAHEDPFAMHLIGAPPAVGDTGGGGGLLTQAQIKHARVENLKNTKAVVDFNTLTDGDYAPRGGGQFDPEDIAAWQEHYEVAIDGILTPATMAKAHAVPRPMPVKPTKHHRVPPPKPRPVPVPYPPLPDPNGQMRPLPPNPPEGLELGDGMMPNTFNRRPHVQHLQRLLEEKLETELGITGEFDTYTLNAVYLAQDKYGLPRAPRIDAALARALTQRQGPHPDVDPALEDLMDAIWLQLQMSLGEANVALDMLKNDLARPTKHGSNLLKDALKFAVRSAIAAIPDFAAMHIMSSFAIHPSDPEDKEKVTAALKAPFDVIKDDIDKIFEMVFEGDHRRPPQLAAPDFIEVQRLQLTRREASAQEVFLLHTKQVLRKQPRRDPQKPAPAHDPRRERANESLRVYRDVRYRSLEKQYFRSFNEWATSLARADLDPADGPPDPNHVDMTNKDVDDARGVLFMTFEGNERRPDAPVENADGSRATLRGVSREAARILQYRPVKNVTMPLHAKILVKGDQGDPIGFVVSRSGDAQWWKPESKDTEPRVRRYLATKGHGYGAPVSDAAVSTGAYEVARKDINSRWVGPVEVIE